MNYIRELNAFYDWLETNPLPPSCVALWHALMHTCSRAGWPKEFAVAVKTLELKTGMNRRTVERSRNTLVQNGLLKWRKRSGNQSAVYELISIADKIMRQNDAQNVAQHDVECDAQSVAQDVAHSVAINKQNKTKLNKTETTSTNPYRLFESEGFGTISSFIAESLQDLIDTYGEVWVCEAMKEAVRQGKRKLSYVHGILKSWAADGMRRSIDRKPEQRPAGPYVPGAEESRKYLEEQERLERELREGRRLGSA